MKKLLFVILFYSNLLSAQDKFKDDIEKGKINNKNRTVLKNKLTKSAFSIRKNIQPDNFNKRQNINDCPDNIGFENGDFSFWQTNIGSVDTIILLNDTINFVNLPNNTWLNGVNTPSPPQRQQLQDRNVGGLDYYGQFPINPPNGRGGRYAVKLGSDEDAIGSNRPNKKAESVRYVINVPNPSSNFSITFSYAVVLENPDGSNGGNPHAKFQQPRFKAVLYNASNGTPVPCASFDFFADRNLPGFFESAHSYEHSTDASVQCKNWTDVFVNLDRYAGQTMYLEFTTADCTKGGHFGYAYVDVVECGLSSTSQYDCLTGNAVFTGPPGFQNYEWYNSNYTLALGNTQNISVSNAIPDSNYWCIVTPFNVTGCVGCICKDTIGVKASVFLPFADAGNSTSLCLNDSVQIGTNAISGYDYSWSPTTGLSDYTSSSPLASPNASIQYILTVTDNSTGCFTKDSIMVNIKPSPNAGFFVNDNTQCSNNNHFSFIDSSFISSGFYTQTWNFGDGNVVNTNNPDHVYNFPGEYEVSLTIISDLNCIDSIRFPVRVIENPVSNFTFDNNVQCLNNNLFHFQINQPTVNTIYTWDFGDNSASVNSVNPSHIYTRSDSFLVQVFANYEGCADTSSSMVYLANNPEVNIRGNRLPVICSGDSILLHAVYTSGSGTVTRINWYKNNSLIAGANTDSILVTSGGNYKFEIINSFGCVDDDSILVTVHPLPSGNLGSPAQYNICPGESVLLTANGGNTYQWYLNGNIIPNQSNDSLYANAAGKYSVELISSYGCKSMLPSIIELKKTENPIPDFTFNENCINTPIKFYNQSNVANSGNVIYSWDFTDPPGSNSINPSHIFDDPGFYLVKLIIASEKCINVRDSILKVIKIVPNPRGIRYQEVNAVVNQPQQLEARNIGLEYQWQPFIALNNYRIVRPIFTFNRDVEYLVHIKDQSGCKIIDTVLVRVFGNSEIYVPNAFTPNKSGGANDHMYPILVGMMKLKFFRIFDRWGKLVFESSQALPGWDGYYNGKPQPMDTYTWTLQAVDINGKLISKAGNCVLIR